MIRAKVVGLKGTFYGDFELKKANYVFNSPKKIEKFTCISFSVQFVRYGSIQLPKNFTTTKVRFLIKTDFVILSFF